MTLRSYTGDPALDSIITREIRYSQSRWAEVWLALQMLLVGAILLTPVPTFIGPQWAVIATFVTETTAGSVALAVGGMRVVALWINGRRRETPLARLLGCQGGFLFWMSLLVGFIQSAVQGGPLPIIIALFAVSVVAELHSAWRCGGDIIAADSLRFRDRERRRQRADEERGGDA